MQILTLKGIFFLILDKDICMSLSILLWDIYQTWDESFFFMV